MQQLGQMPGLKDISKDLRMVVKDGIRGLDDDVALPTLSTLRCVHQELQGENPLDVVMAVERVITRAIDTFAGTPPFEVLRRLFGLTPGTTGKLAKQRRRAAAIEGRVEPETFNRHEEQRLLGLLARRVYEFETAARLIEARLGPRPAPKEVKATWFERFVHYHRMQAVLGQLRQHLLALLLTYSDVKDEKGQAEYLESSLWLYARFLVAHDRFTDELGGIWLLPDPEADAEVATAIERVLWHPPFNERARSWLRTTIVQVSNGELHPFERWLEDGPEGQELLGLWQQWVESCACGSEPPKPDCRPHQLIDQAERYVMVVEDQWERVRERYRDLPALNPAQ